MLESGIIIGIIIALSWILSYTLLVPKNIKRMIESKPKAALIIDFLAAGGISSFVIVGNSMTGVVAATSAGFILTSFTTFKIILHKIKTKYLSNFK